MWFCHIFLLHFSIKYAISVDIMCRNAYNKSMLFDITHSLYLIISYLLTIGGLIACYFFLKKDEQKRFILKLSAVITVIIHYSSLWVDLFSTGEPDLQDSMLLPIYPCNICMWLLLITAFCKKRDNIAFNLLSEFTFWAGTVCGTIGILLNENYANTPTLADYDILKGLLSHSTMVFGALYLRVSGTVKIRVFNTVSATCGLLLFLVDGLLINGLFSLFKLEPCNCMYLQEPPFPDMPWLQNYVMGAAAVLLVFGVTALYEYFALPKEERWYRKLKQKINARKGE